MSDAQDRRGFGTRGAEESAIAAAEAPKFEYVSWTKEPHLRRLYFLTIFLMVASATTGYDGMLVNTSQQMDLWSKFFGWKVQDANYLGILINMFSIGSIVSFFITPYVADHFGRKASISLGCFFMILGGCLTAFTNGYEMYLAGRFVLGFGNSLSQMASPMLLTEICHPQHRGPVTAIYNCLWNLGALVVSCIGWGTIHVQNDWSWRSITFIQVVPSVIQLVGIWWVPESPRYLLSKDRAEEALAVLAKHHGGGDVNNLTVQFEYREIRETLAVQKSADRSSRYIDFLRTKGNRWRLAILISIGIISQYSGNALFSNYMNAIYEGAGITDQNQKLGISTGNTILNLSVTIIAALCVDKFGRRPLFLLSTAGMVGSFVCWTICGAVYENALIHQDGTDPKTGEPLKDINGNPASGYAQLVFIWIFGIFYGIGFSGLLVAYALEILPFALRAKGMMIMNITVQAILAIGNQTNKLAWDNLPHHWNFMLFYTIWDTCELIFVYFFYVETKGPTLEEIARIFDGDQAVAHLDIHQVEKEIHGAEHEEDVAERHMRSEKTAV